MASTLGRAEIPERIPYARTPQKLPVILSADEVVRFLQAISCLRNRVAMTTAYASGLRISEAARLKTADIDSSRMVIRVESGKGVNSIARLSPRKSAGKESFANMPPTLAAARITASGFWRCI